MSEPELAHAELVGAEVVGQLVAHRARHLVAQPLRVVAEVAQQRVAEDHDPVVEEVVGDGVALVEPVCPPLATAVVDDDRDVLQRAVKLEREVVDRRAHERLEVVLVVGVEELLVVLAGRVVLGVAPRLLGCEPLSALQRSGGLQVASEFLLRSAWHARDILQSGTLTAVDLGSMLYMWSVPVRPGTATVSWLLVEILFALHGLGVNPRYMLEPAAVLVVLAGAGVGRLLAVDGGPAVLRWLAVAVALSLVFIGVVQLLHIIPVRHWGGATWQALMGIVILAGGVALLVPGVMVATAAWSRHQGSIARSLRGTMGLTRGEAPA